MEMHMYVEIYADEKLIYTSKEVKQKTQPFDFSKSLEGVDYLKIYVSPNWNSEIILSDVKLWK